MDNQHKMISGSVDDPEQLAAKANAEAVAFCSQNCTPIIGEHVGDTDVAHDIACPNVEEGFSAFVRAVAKPEPRF